MQFLDEHDRFYRPQDSNSYLSSYLNELIVLTDARDELPLGQACRPAGVGQFVWFCVTSKALKRIVVRAAEVRPAGLVQKHGFTSVLPGSQWTGDIQSNRGDTELGGQDGLEVDAINLS